LEVKTEGKRDHRGEWKNSRGKGDVPYTWSRGRRKKRKKHGISLRKAPRECKETKRFGKDMDENSTIRECKKKFGGGRGEGGSCLCP